MNRLNAYKSSIIADISFIQLSESKEAFELSVRLFIEKYSAFNNEDVTQFLAYFNQEWIQKHPNWYEGVDPGSPSHNNNLEATNRWIKDSGTSRKLLPLPDLIQVFERLLTDHSNRDEHERSISKAFAAEALAWRRNRPPGEPVIEDANDECFHFFSTSASQDRFADAVQAFKDRGDCVDFDKYVHARIDVICVHEKEELLSCYCITYLKKRQCVHVLALLAKREKVRVEASELPLGFHRKAGHPTRVMAGVMTSLRRAAAAYIHRH